MKIALTNLGGYITDRNKDGISNFECLGIADNLRKYCDVDVLTCCECEGCITVDSNYDINSYDALVVVNTNINIWGGVERVYTTEMQKLLAKYNDNIYYIYSETKAPYFRYWKMIKNKTWTKEKGYTEEMFVPKKGLIVLSQFPDLEWARRQFGASCVEVEDIINVPIAFWILNKQLEDFKPNETDLFSMVEHKDVDLIYGGGFRGGSRKEKMMEYYFGRKNISVEMYGNIKLEDFEDIGDLKPPKFSNKIKACEVIKKDSNSFATVIIGDPENSNNNIHLRFVQALISNIVCFIDNDFDSYHKLLKDDFFYVHNGDELEEKILYLKANLDIRDEYLNKQKAILNELKEKYDLGKIIYNIINKK